MIELQRHLPLQSTAWSESDAAVAIEDIVADALGDFQAGRFWPAHPLDERLNDGHAGFYMGTTGVIWGVDYLRRIGAIVARFDFCPVLPQLLEANRAELPRYGDYARHGSLLFGDLGATLLVMRLASSPAIADLVHERADANTSLPVRELMWGLPGSMIACVHMAAMTGEARWRELFVRQARRLLDDLQETEEGPLWTQDLYGRQMPAT
jgi:hypothetical protein